MPDETMYYLFDLLGFLRNVIQYEDGLIPIFIPVFMEKFGRGSPLHPC